MAEALHERPLSGEPVEASDWQPPARAPLEGRLVRLEPLEPARHAADLFACAHDGSAAASCLWDFLPYGPFESEAAMRTWLEGCAAQSDPLFFALVDRRSGRALGMASYLRITPAQGVIEIGHIWFSPALQRTAAATEAIFLMIAHAFDGLGYRRVEWKCNALNEGSRAAARRFGFRYEGTFYRHLVVKGRNRDTAWYALIDSDWPTAGAAFRAWLAPENFDANGRQRRRLAELMAL
ncbi:MAG: GNAT family protein [Tistlia sp.]|uniref:GNAT family N-acetyltransferase n=1 Tax=Tistlia sp. TaxID=3057121 RepID=UPI0034A36D41